MAGVDKGLSSCTLKAESQRPGTRLPGLAADARPPLGRSHCYAISFMDGGGSPFRSIAPSLVRFANSAFKSVQHSNAILGTRRSHAYQLCFGPGVAAFRHHKPDCFWKDFGSRRGESDAARRLGSAIADCFPGQQSNNQPGREACGHFPVVNRSRARKLPAEPGSSRRHPAKGNQQDFRDLLYGRYVNSTRDYQVRVSGEPKGLI